ncbi:DapH/DapD/GlmU-related protein [Pseudacidovorax intermedius]|uniref:serine O-acetyltransferase n=1 Tax=Pseudacidovorax intermedius TaxID=433924 RepID=UPI000E0CAD56
MTRNGISAKILLFFCKHNIPVVSRLIRIVFNSDIYCAIPRGLHLPHPYGIVIHSKCEIGAHVTIMQQVTIGGNHTAAGSFVPNIGDDVFIGAGAKVLGAVRIGHGAIIGANAVVTRNVPAHCTVVGANRIIRSKND